MMHILKQKKMILDLQNAGIKSVDDYTPFPKPYYINHAYVQAIYLGCDPSNKWEKRFHHAFALPHGEEYDFGKFVEDLHKNLVQVGLGWDNVNVQNLCQNYFTEETSKNPDWKIAVEFWIPILRAELAQIASHIPVLMTSEMIYKVLLNPKSKTRRAESFYKCEEPNDLFVRAEHNKLRRTLIPFYRHPKYRLTNEDWQNYKQAIADYIGSNHLYLASR